MKIHNKHRDTFLASVRTGEASSLQREHVMENSKMNTLLDRPSVVRLVQRKSIFMSKAVFRGRAGI